MKNEAISVAVIEGASGPGVARAGGCILVEDELGGRRPASARVRSGRARKIANARVTDERTAVPAAVVVHAKAMKGP
ncbi:MAG TPA: hypothetical protein VFS43_23300 [Polyangiaceae bacterium]|nr:hypothetical protein [Polyangiaceae bacterium]